MNKQDLYASVTAGIVAALEAGVRPWTHSYNLKIASLPVRHSGEYYQGGNVIALWDSMLRNGFLENRFMTYKQAEQANANIRKGSKGTRIIKLVKFADKDGDPEIKDRLAVAQYTVFNVEQIDGLPEELAVKLAPLEERLEKADLWLSQTGANIVHSGHQSFYRRATDLVNMARLEHFTRQDDYVATKAHELVHWTMHETRLNRQQPASKESKEYAMEELIAEIGAAFLCAKLGVECVLPEQHAGYLQYYLPLLKDDPKALFSAASAAQKAVEYLEQCVSSAQPQQAAA
jgi:antirestriction protein ArdC